MPWKVTLVGELTLKLLDELGPIQRGIASAEPTTGEYALEGLPPGAYTVLATATMGWAVEGARIATRVISLQDGQTVEHIDFDFQ